MKNTVKRLIQFRFNQYNLIEEKLEKMAKKGLFLEKIGSTFWTFRKAEPKNLTYTVTYFSEASIFNPSTTENQNTFFDYAKESGWNFVTQFHQMQIFSNENETPIPFETDESEKFKTITKCMKKSFLPSIILLIVVFMLNLLGQYFIFKQNRINFLADFLNYFPIGIILPTFLYCLYSLIDYFIWCRQCKVSFASGGGCIQNNYGWKKVLDILFNAYIFIFSILFLLHLFHLFHLTWVFLIVLPAPLSIIIFRASLAFFKKKKQSARRNRIFSYGFLIVVHVLYFFFLILFVLKSNFPLNYKSNYRTISWQITKNQTKDFKLYNDNIPLTCEHLYGDISYNNYSYKKTSDRTIFLTRTEYSQKSLPSKKSPPNIYYTNFEPRFSFVYDIITEDIKKIPEWSYETLKSLDNHIFHTTKAYQFYNNSNPTGDYLLFYNDKIIKLDFEEAATTEQISIIKDKLNLP